MHGTINIKLKNYVIKIAVIIQNVTKYQFVSLGTALDLRHDAVTTTNGAKKRVDEKFYRRDGYITSWTNPRT